MQAVPYMLLLCGAAAIALSITAHAWRYRTIAGAIPLAWLALAVAEWVLTYALELGAPGESSKLLWAKLQYAGIVSVPVAWLVFSVSYAGIRTSWIYRLTGLLLPIPLCTFVLTLTNESHHLIWRDTHLALHAAFPALEIAHGPWFWFHAGFAYVLMLAGSIMLLRLLLRSPGRYRRQVGAVLIGALAPWIGNALYLAGINPFFPLDLTPFALTFSVGLLGWSLFRFHLLEIVPIAHSTIVDSMRDGVIVLDARCHIVDLNPSAEAILDVRAARSRGQALDLALPGQEALARRCATPDESTVEITISRHAAERIYEAHILKLLSQRRGIKGRIVILHDITERAQAAGQLRRQHAELAALHETTLGLINRLDVDSLLELLVIRAGALLDTAHGYLYVVDPSGDELVVRVATGVFTPHVGERLGRGEGLAGHVWASGEALAIDNYSAWDRRRLDFELLQLRSVVCVPIRAGAEFVGILGLAYLEPARTFGTAEITLLQRFANMASLVLENARLYGAARQELAERRRAEQALLAAEADLRAAKDLAEAATQAKSEFLQYMSHEIRTPISSVVGVTELLLLTRLTSRQREYAEMIRTSGDTLNTLIDNFLDLSKIETGKLDLRSYPFEVAWWIEQAIDLVAANAARKQLDLAYAIAPGTPTTLLGDWPRLSQMLVNLLSNAVKFTHAGGIFVAVKADGGRMHDRGAERNDHPPERLLGLSSCTLHVSVADSGIGIPPEQLEAVFDAFHQLRSPGERPRAGTGLGLTISRRLSELMGGRMWAESTPGAGSTFHFTAIVQAAAVEPSGEQPAARELVDKRLLLVGEYAQSERAIVQYGEAAGMRIRASGSVAEALAWIGAGDIFDIAILGIHNAALQASAAEQLRRAHPVPLPIVLLAPLDQPMAQAPADQCSRRLRLPLKLSQLQKALLELLAIALLETMRQALDRRDAAALRRAAAQLRASSALIGAPRLAQLCHQIEGAAAALTPDAGASLVEQATAELARVQVALLSDPTQRGD